MKNLISILLLALCVTLTSADKDEYLTICDEWMLMDIECSDGNPVTEWWQRTCTVYWNSGGAYTYVSEYQDDNYIVKEEICVCEDQYNCNIFPASHGCKHIYKRTCCGSEGTNQTTWDCTPWEYYYTDCEDFSLCE